MIFGSRFLTEHDMKDLGFKSLGTNILIDESCIINGIENISIGSNVRIDAFTIINCINGYLKLGSNIHISNNCSLACSGGVELKDFSGLSSGVKIYSASDDYLGRSMTNPTIPGKYKKVKTGKVILEKHVIVGSSSVILPNLTIGEGASIGALSLVKDSLEEWSVYAGSPIKKLGQKLRKTLELEKLYLEEIELNK